MSRILIVEDDESTCHLLSSIITKYAKKLYESEWPVKVMCTPSAQKALELLRVNNYELVITDIMMAKLSGWDLIKYIRSNHKLLDLPILVVSAVDAIDLRYNSAKYGASGWLTKPVHPEEFAKKVFKLIGGR